MDVFPLRTPRNARQDARGYLLTVTPDGKVYPSNAGHLLATLVSPAVPPVRRTKMRRRHLV
jgi:hypothetical protein